MNLKLFHQQGLLQEITWEIMFHKVGLFFTVVKSLYLLMYQNDVRHSRIENIANYVLPFPHYQADLKVSLRRQSI
jgi:hypothetical protein